MRLPRPLDRHRWAVVAFNNGLLRGPDVSVCSTHKTMTEALVQLSYRDSRRGTHLVLRSADVVDIDTSPTAVSAKHYHRLQAMGTAFRPRSVPSMPVRAPRHRVA